MSFNEHESCEKANDALRARVAELEAALKKIGDAAREVLTETPPGKDPMMLAPWVAGTAYKALKPLLSRSTPC